MVGCNTLLLGLAWASPTHIGSLCGCGWFVTFPVVQIWKGPHWQSLIQLWLDSHVPVSVCNEHRRPDTIIFLYDWLDSHFPESICDEYDM